MYSALKHRKQREPTTPNLLGKHKVDEFFSTVSELNAIMCRLRHVCHLELHNVKWSARN